MIQYTRALALIYDMGQCDCRLIVSCIQASDLIPLQYTRTLSHTYDTDQCDRAFIISCLQTSTYDGPLTGT